METNQFFSLKRFYLLLKNDILINHKKYLFTIVGAFIVGFVIFYINMPKFSWWRDFGQDQYFDIFVFYMLGLAVFFGLSFPEMGNKINISKYLLLPSSTFEKFLAQFLIRIVFGTIVLYSVFWIDAHFARIMIQSLFGNPTKYVIETFDFSALFYNENLNKANSLFFGFFSAGTFFFSARLFFRKNALVKSFITFIVLILLGYGLMYILSLLFYPTLPPNDIHVDSYPLSYSHNLKNIDLWLYSILWLSWIFILPLGYFKLKEKQV